MKLLIINYKKYIISLILKIKMSIYNGNSRLLL